MAVRGDMFQEGLFPSLGQASAALMGLFGTTPTGVAPKRPIGAAEENQGYRMGEGLA